VGFLAKCVSPIKVTSFNLLHMLFDRVLYIPLLYGTRPNIKEPCTFPNLKGNGCVNFHEDLAFLSLEVFSRENTCASEKHQLWLSGFSIKKVA
jgi:hypothetical protein